MAVNKAGEIFYEAERIGFIGECGKKSTICKSGDFRQFTERRTVHYMSFLNIISCVIFVLFLMCNVVNAQGCDYTGR